MKEKKILVLLPVTEEDKEYLVSRAQGAAQPCSFEFRKIEEATAEEIAASHIIIGKLPVTLCDSILPKLSFLRDN